MGQRRTRKDKIIAQLRRKVRSVPALSDTVEIESMSVGMPEPQQASEPKPTPSLQGFLSLFSYDPLLIRKDLLKTLRWAFLAFMLEIGLYFFLR